MGGLTGNHRVTLTVEGYQSEALGIYSHTDGILLYMFIRKHRTSREKRWFILKKYLSLILAFEINLEKGNREEN